MDRNSDATSYDKALILADPPDMAWSLICASSILRRRTFAESSTTDRLGSYQREIFYKLCDLQPIMSASIYRSPILVAKQFPS